MAMKREEMQHKADALSFEQSFKLQELAVNTEIEKAKIEAQLTMASQAEASASQAATEAGNKSQEVKVTTVDPTTLHPMMAQLHESMTKLADLHAKEKPPIVVPAPAVHVAAPQIHVPAPIVNVAHAPAAKKGKRTVKARKETDGSFTFESGDE